MKIPALFVVSYFILFCSISFLHVNFFQVDVILYAYIFNCILAIFIIFPFLIYKFGFNKDLWYLVVIKFLIGISFSIYVPTVVDRSLSLYLVQKIYERGAINSVEFRDIITNDYLRDHAVINVRIAEQIASGTVKYYPENDCFQVTGVGKFVVRGADWFRKFFIPRYRLVGFDYSDSVWIANQINETEPKGACVEDLDHRDR